MNIPICFHFPSATVLTSVLNKKIQKNKTYENISHYIIVTCITYTETCICGSGIKRVTQKACNRIFKMRFKCSLQIITRKYRLLKVLSTWGNYILPHFVIVKCCFFLFVSYFNFVLFSVVVCLIFFLQWSTYHFVQLFIFRNDIEKHISRSELEWNKTKIFTDTHTIYFNGHAKESTNSVAI